MFLYNSRVDVSINKYKQTIAAMLHSNCRIADVHKSGTKQSKKATEYNTVMSNQPKTSNMIDTTWHFHRIHSHA